MADRAASSLKVLWDQDASKRLASGLQAACLIRDQDKTRRILAPLGPVSLELVSSWLVENPAQVADLCSRLVIL